MPIVAALKRHPLVMVILFLCLLALVYLGPPLGSFVSQLEVGTLAGKQAASPQVGSFTVDGVEYLPNAIVALDLSGIVLTSEEISQAATALLEANGAIRSISMTFRGITVTAQVFRSSECGPDPSNNQLRGFMFRWGDYQRCFDSFEKPEDLVMDFLEWLGFRTPR